MTVTHHPPADPRHAFCALVRGEGCAAPDPTILAVLDEALQTVRFDTIDPWRLPSLALYIARLVNRRR